MSAGISSLHGPHQVAQKLMSSGLPLNSLSCTSRPFMSFSVKAKFACSGADFAAAASEDAALPPLQPAAVTTTIEIAASADNICRRPRVLRVPRVSLNPLSTWTPTLLLRVGSPPPHDTAVLRRSRRAEPCAPVFGHDQRVRALLGCKIQVVPPVGAVSSPMLSR